MLVTSVHSLQKLSDFGHTLLGRGLVAAPFVLHGTFDRTAGLEPPPLSQDVLKLKCAKSDRNAWPLLPKGILGSDCGD